MMWLLANSLIFSTSDSVYELSNMPMMGQKCHCLKYSLCFPERFLNQVDLDEKKCFRLLRTHFNHWRAINSHLCSK